MKTHDYIEAGIKALEEENKALKSHVYDLEKKLEGSKVSIKSIAERHKSQMMSVYYLLTAVSKTGTHGEKRNVIMYLQAVLQDLISRGDSLPLSDEEINNYTF